MNGDVNDTMHLYLQGMLEPAPAAAFEDQLQNDPALADEWRGFLVEQYLAQALPDRWKVKFKSLSEQEPAFKSEIRFQKEVQEKMRLLKREQLKQEVKGLLPKTQLYMAYPSKKAGPKRYLMYMAAAGLTLLLTLYLFNNQAPDSNDLYAEYFEPYPMLLAQRAGDQSVREQAAISAYQEGNYAAALQYFEMLNNESPGRPEYLLYAAISALETHKGVVSRSYLSKLRPFENYHEPQDWYTALSWLKDGEVEKAKKALKRISQQPKNHYAIKAKRLLRELPG